MSSTGIPESIARLIGELSKLPGIGEKNATRLAFHIFRYPRENADNLVKAIIDTRTKVVLCEECFSFSSESPCAICVSAGRDAASICASSRPLDAIAIERSGEFQGRATFSTASYRRSRGIGRNPQDKGALASPGQAP
ncbi:MAG: hypothetical protein R3B51_01320 [Thermodesulfobacteriota bacterium]